jgi:nitrogenase molybdenum-iron protein alpha/beta subunit
MKLIKGFPPPSFHMGVLLILSQIPGLIVVEFGAEGTMRYFLNTLQMMGRPSQARMFTTMMDESSVVLGSYERLRRTVVELDEEYRPPFIAVVDSTIASVIGADIEGACRQFQKEVASRLIPIQENNLSKSFEEGIRFAKKCLEESEMADLNVIEDAAGTARHLSPYFLTGQYEAEI